MSTQVPQPQNEDYTFLDVLRTIDTLPDRSVWIDKPTSPGRHHQ